MTHGITFRKGNIGLALALFALLLLAPASRAAAPDTWSPTGSLTLARSLHTASLLPSGNVLAAGGVSGTTYLDSAEIYDTAAGTWRVTRHMISQRSLHSAVVLQDGRVLVVGGFNGAYLQSAELFSPGPETWAAAASMGARRSGATATVLQDGKVLVVGGFDGATYLSSGEVYNPATNTWSPTANGLGAGRVAHTATLLPNGKVLIAGGVSPHATRTSALYDPATNSFSPAASMSVARGYHTGTLLQDGRVLVAGGLNNTTPLASAELYDPARDTWTTAAALADPRGQHAATLLPSGRVLVEGGLSSPSTAMPTAEIYNPIRDGWSPAASLANDRADQTATLLGNGLVLVAGGGTGPGGVGALQSSELYTSPVVPDAPTGVRATPGDRSAQVTWSAPVSDGGLPVVSYTITASPGGATVTVPGGSRLTGFPGLQNGTSYTFRVTASNDIGAGPPSASSNAITPRAGLARFGVAPVLKGLALKPGTFRVRSRGRGGSKVSYRLSAKAKVTFTVQRGVRCKKHRCRRYVAVRGKFAKAGRKGKNRFRFNGRMAKRALRSGDYRLVAKPVDSIGQKGRSVRKRFRVIR